MANLTMPGDLTGRSSRVVVRECFTLWDGLRCARDADVFLGAGWTLVRARAAMGDSLGKVRLGILLMC